MNKKNNIISNIKNITKTAIIAVGDIAVDAAVAMAVSAATAYSIDCAAAQYDAYKNKGLQYKKPLIGKEVLVDGTGKAATPSTVRYSNAVKTVKLVGGGVAGFAAGESRRIERGHQTAVNTAVLKTAKMLNDISFEVVED